MKDGFSLIELLLAFALLTGGMLAASVVAYRTPSVLQNAYKEAGGHSNAHAVLEHALLFARANFTGLINATTTAPDSNTSLTLYPLDDAAARILSTTRWNTLGGFDQSVSYNALITDYKHPADHPCQPFISSDWLHPRIVGSYALTSSSLLPADVPNGPYPISSIAALGTVLGVTISSTTRFDDPTLFFFRIGDTGTPPTYLNSHDNTQESKVGFTSLTAGNNYMYATNGFSSVSTSTSCSYSVATCRQVHMFQINGTVPSQGTRFQIPTTTPTSAVTTSGGVAPGAAIAYRAGKLYLGLGKTAAGQEFIILDISNIYSPKVLGGMRVGRSVNAISVDDSYAYVATDDNSTGGKAIITYDIRNPAAPVEVGSHGYPGAGFARVVSRAQSYLLTGRTYATGTSEEFSLLSADKSLSRVSGADIGTSTSHSSVRGILVRDFIAFILTDNQLQLWNIADPTHPLPYSSLTLPHGSATSFTCKQNVLFIGSVEADGTGYITTVTGS